MYLYGLKFNSIFAKKSPTMKQCLLIIVAIICRFRGLSVFLYCERFNNK
jgi:hypothetical protein